MVDGDVEGDGDGEVREMKGDGDIYMKEDGDREFGPNSVRL